MTSKWIPTWKNERLMSFSDGIGCREVFEGRDRLSYLTPVKQSAIECTSVRGWQAEALYEAYGWRLLRVIEIAQRQGQVHIGYGREIWISDDWEKRSERATLQIWAWADFLDNYKKNNCWVVRLSDREPVRRGSTWGWSLSVRHATRAPELFPKGRNKEKAVRFLSVFDI